jgi:hypothetical protein
VVGSGVGQVTGQGGVDGPNAGDFPGPLGQAEQGSQRDGRVDLPDEPGRHRARRRSGRAVRACRPRPAAVLPACDVPAGPGVFAEQEVQVGAGAQHVQLLTGYFTETNRRPVKDIGHLLLPVVISTIPLWIQHRDYISRSRRVTHGVVIVAWTGFVIAGYLVPLNWTGFRGQTLWNWFELLLLPTALATTMTLTSMGVPQSKVLRSLRPFRRESWPPWPSGGS